MPVTTNRPTLSGVTKAQMERAFEASEKGVRLEPQNYRSEGESRCLGVSQVSAERAEYFFGLLTLEQGKRAK